jgi:hypothetical protein
MNADRVLLFNYSDEQWSEIEAAMQAIRTGALPDDAGAELLQAARIYQARMADPHPAQDKRWKKVGRQTERLQELFWPP